MSARETWILRIIERKLGLKRTMRPLEQHVAGGGHEIRFVPQHLRNYST
jgi:hypothetical protein